MSWFISSIIWKKIRASIVRWLMRKPRVPKSIPEHLKLMKESWEGLSASLDLGAVSFLKERNDRWDEEEFFLVGERFVERMVTRFVEYEPTALLLCKSILEIGCGAGRFLKPLSTRFKRVIGVDISEEMLKRANHLLSSCDNVELRINNGLDLSDFEDDSFDYCICAGVFQHITSTEVINNYIREALRILKPTGMFLFQFRAYEKEQITNNVRVGARLTAKDLDQALYTYNFRILEISNDPIDPDATLVVVIQKVSSGESVPDSKRLFSQQRIVNKSWLSGVYNGISIAVTARQLQPGEKARRIAFFDI